MTDDDGWRRVVYAHECYGDSEGSEILICPYCAIEYAECPCPGPHQDDLFAYRDDHRGVLWARRHDGQLDLFSNSPHPATQLEDEGNAMWTSN